MIECVWLTIWLCSRYVGNTVQDEGHKVPNIQVLHKNLGHKPKTEEDKKNLEFSQSKCAKSGQFYYPNSQWKNSLIFSRWSEQISAVLDFSTVQCFYFVLWGNLVGFDSFWMCLMYFDIIWQFLMYLYIFRQFQMYFYIFGQFLMYLYTFRPIVRYNFKCWNILRFYRRVM